MSQQRGTVALLALYTTLIYAALAKQESTGEQGAERGRKSQEFPLSAISS